MKIHILCNDGSPLGVTPETIYGDTHRVGVGGAELALLTLAVAWSKAHEVVLYNDPFYKSGQLDQRPISAFSPSEDRDILITFRSPNHRTPRAVGKRIWWSCDQQTVGDFRQFSRHNHSVVTISPRHQEYFRSTYGIQSRVIDIPVRTWEYFELRDVPKIQNKLLFSSVPDRGLNLLAAAYPLIKRRVPSVSLSITSDYRLWGQAAGDSGYRHKFMSMRDVTFHGALPRKRLLLEQMSADVLAYPCTYDELFCIAVAEAQVAGAYPITSGKGAVATTNMGKIVPGNVEDFRRGWLNLFVEQVCEFLELSPERKEQIRKENKEKAVERFSLATILEQWNEVFNA